MSLWIDDDDPGRPGQHHIPACAVLCSLGSAEMAACVTADATLRLSGDLELHRLRADGCPRGASQLLWLWHVDA